MIPAVSKLFRIRFSYVFLSFKLFVVQSSCVCFTISIAPLFVFDVPPAPVPTDVLFFSALAYVRALFGFRVYLSARCSGLSLFDFFSCSVLVVQLFDLSLVGLSFFPHMNTSLGLCSLRFTPLEQFI